MGVHTLQIEDLRSKSKTRAVFLDRDLEGYESGSDLSVASEGRKAKRQLANNRVSGKSRFHLFANYRDADFTLPTEYTNISTTPCANAGAPQFVGNLALGTYSADINTYFFTASDMIFPCLWRRVRWQKKRSGSCGRQVRLVQSLMRITARLNAMKRASVSGGVPANAEDATAMHMGAGRSMLSIKAISSIRRSVLVVQSPAKNRCLWKKISLR